MVKPSRRSSRRMKPIVELATHKRAETRRPASPLRFAQPRTASRRIAPHRFAPPASPRPRYSNTQGASAATRRWREQRGGACCGERRGPARANRGACPPVVPARVPCTQVAVAAICVARACAHLRRRARSRRDLAPASRRRAPRGTAGKAPEKRHNATTATRTYGAHAVPAGLCGGDTTDSGNSTGRRCAQMCGV